MNALPIPPIRPSALPMLRACPRFAGTGSADADAGSARHDHAAALLRADVDAPPPAPAGMSAEDVEGVRWYVEQVRLRAPLSEYPLAVEHKMSFDGPHFEAVAGTVDAVCGPWIGDLKWSKCCDYAPQMAAYALMLIGRGWAEVTVELFFAKERKIETLKFTRTDAEAVVDAIILAAIDPAAAPRTCDFCGWCRHAATCPAVSAKAATVAAGYAEDAALRQWHPSKMETGAEIADALRIWREVLKPWGGSLEHHALEAAVTRGLTLPGFSLSTRKGKQWCADVAGAFARAGLPQAEFLKCCDLRLNTSKTHPDKPGIVDTYIAAQGETLTAKRAAKKSLMAKLEPVMRQGPETQYLRAEKSITTEGEDTPF